MILTALFFTWCLQFSMGTDLNQSTANTALRQVEKQFLDPETRRKAMVDLKLRMLRVTYLERNKTVPQESFDAVLKDNSSGIDDMLQTPEQFLARKMDLERREYGSKRGRMSATDFVKVPSARWIMPIKYYTASINDPTALGVIESAVKEYEEKSKGCIKFQKVNVKPLGPHMFFVDKPKDVCGGTAYVGQWYHGNEVNIGGGCWDLLILIHEMGHALAFEHTQTRPDRDNYIRINLENVDKGSEWLFEKYANAATDQGEYDYGSIMHYTANAFAKRPDLETMTPLHDYELNKERMGHAPGLSDIDIKRLIDIYCSPFSELVPPCVDHITSCNLIKQAACGKLRDSYESDLYMPMIDSCPLTCQMCDRSKPDPNYVFPCKDSDGCYQMAYDCHQSSDVEKRMRAHFKCPRACGVCKEKPIDDPNCKDTISSCSSIAEKACLAQYGTSEHTAMVNRCRRTCMLCDVFPASAGELDDCFDWAAGCDQTASRGDCQSQNLNVRTEAQLNCARSCGLCAV